MNGFMYKVARFFQGRYGIDKLFYGICGVAGAQCGKLVCKVAYFTAYGIRCAGAGGSEGDVKKLPEAIRGEHEV